MVTVIHVRLYLVQGGYYQTAWGEVQHQEPGAATPPSLEGGHAGDPPLPPLSMLLMLP